MSQQVTTFTPEQITAAVKKLVSAGRSMARSVETVLVMAVYDSIVNKSAATANALIGALRMSTKKTGIVAFLEKHGQLYDKGGKVGFVHFALGAAERLEWTPEYVEIVQEEAQGWESYKPAAPETVLDMMEAVAALLKKHETAVKNEKKVVDGELAEYLKALVAQYSAKKALAKATESAAVSVAATEKEAITA